jgi:flavin reductase (DIM6/NTAB) family NADH-FMN oxidoreductase RutF
MQKKTSLQDAFRCKYPDPVVLVTTRGPNGRANVMAVSWFTLASDDPWMFVLGIDDGAYTYKLIRQTREFVVAYPHDGMARATFVAGSQHGQHADKIKLTGLKLQDATVVRAPLLADAIANFECSVVKILKPGNCPLIVGRIVAAHRNTRTGLKRLFNLAKGYRLGRVTPGKPLV